MSPIYLTITKIHCWSVGWLVGVTINFLLQIISSFSFSVLLLLCQKINFPSPFFPSTTKKYIIFLQIFPSFSFSGFLLLHKKIYFPSPNISLLFLLRFSSPPWTIKFPSPNMLLLSKYCVRIRTSMRDLHSYLV